ncbi:MAG TPA: Type 1 glutamine amidotransferase-like domain-containing protein [Patescibacteria group bacterium]|nr:Type 1 glutamine amidotransferase-like domain-containing protein [Patescibacteria group bacterium]
MKLLLTSFACKTLDNVRPLLNGDPAGLRAAFIPTAADPYDDKDFVKVDRDKLVELGFAVTDIDIKDKTEIELAKLLASYDLVLVAGGNTYYLLYHAQKSGFMNVIKKRLEDGMVYVGSSAGSILACLTIDTARRFDSPSIVPELADYTGMDLVDFLIIPHFDAPRYQERLRQTIEEWSGKHHHLYPLTDSQAIMVDGDTITFVDVSMGNA